MYLKKIVYEVGVGNCLMCAQGWGRDLQERKQLQIPGGIAGGGGMVIDQIEPCIILTGCGISRPSRLCSAGSSRT